MVSYSKHLLFPAIKLLKSNPEMLKFLRTIAWGKQLPGQKRSICEYGPRRGALHCFIEFQNRNLIERIFSSSLTEMILSLLGFLYFIPSTGLLVRHIWACRLIRSSVNCVVMLQLVLVLEGVSLCPDLRYRPIGRYTRTCGACTPVATLNPQPPPAVPNSRKESSGARGGACFSRIWDNERSIFYKSALVLVPLSTQHQPWNS